ncbi:hypothetical protein [Clostridium manihotivorum]|uniref:Uncharacterized protein n=1 Tax=Clostridium manihotivorum TaxID=2320868 RepID=A0A410DSS6_9CLOT|nr:hypothetical protein [Clostridium manihotivorum]QAA32090.1 hypothetical protein C1I91_10705 [Clostridium manihotivorum]
MSILAGIITVVVSIVILTAFVLMIKESNISDIKLMLLGIEITLVGIFAGILALLGLWLFEFIAAIIVVIGIIVTLKGLKA